MSFKCTVLRFDSHILCSENCNNLVNTHLINTMKRKGKKMSSCNDGTWDFTLLIAFLCREAYGSGNHNYHAVHYIPRT